MTRAPHPKLVRLQLDLEQIRVTLRGLTDLYAQTRAEMQREIATLGSGLSRAAQSYWRPGDDPGIFLTLPQGEQAHLQQEVRSARAVADLQGRMAALRLRMAPLESDAHALSHLVTKLEAYDHDHR